MAACSYCETPIWFGGKRDGSFRFCNNECRQKGILLSIADRMPSDIVRQHINAVHSGPCPHCNGPGPVDVHNSYRVWSALLLTSWRTQPHICCRPCAKKRQLNDTAFSLLLGWWGVPWGLLITPMQVAKNIGALRRGPDPTKATPQLQKLVKLNPAQRIVEYHQETPAAR